MLAYLIRRLLLIVPTLLGIMTVNFFIIQIVPGGPVEQMVALLSGHGVSSTERFSGGGNSGETMNSQSNSLRSDTASNTNSKYRGARGLSPDLIVEIEKMYGMDQPIHIRFLKMLKSYVTFDFGQSFYQDRKVVDLVLDKMPVSMSLGLWTALLIYAISIPLGITKAVRDGTRFDAITSTVVTIGYAIPIFLFALLLIILFAGGRYFTWFPLRGLASEGWEDFDTPHRIIDYLWHLVLPITASVVSGFATLTMLTKNSFIDQIGMQYVMTARSKGLSENRVLYGHIFRNAMLIVIAGFPSAFIGILFTGSIFIEILFSLDGMGLLGYEAAISRDYPIMFASLYFFSLLGLVLGIISDLTYAFVDPRIDFESREV